MLECRETPPRQPRAALTPDCARSRPRAKHTHACKTQTKTRTNQMHITQQVDLITDIYDAHERQPLCSGHDTPHQCFVSTPPVDQRRGHGADAAQPLDPRLPRGRLCNTHGGRNKPTVLSALGACKCFLTPLATRRIGKTRHIEPGTAGGWDAQHRTVDVINPLP
jgi:hypothetical protein